MHRYSPDREWCCAAFFSRMTGNLIATAVSTLAASCANNAEQSESRLGSASSLLSASVELDVALPLCARSRDSEGDAKASSDERARSLTPVQLLPRKGIPVVLDELEHPVLAG